MAFQTVTKYFLIFLILNLVGIFVAYNFWWTDGVRLSYFGKETAALLFSAGISWFGVVYLSIYISRKIILKNDKYQFIGLLDIYQVEIFSRNIIDSETRKKVVSILPFVAFPMMIALIVFFVIAMSEVENYQLNKYGTIELVEIKRTENTIRQIPYNHIEYNNEKNSINLPQTHYKVHDKVKIIYSYKNPKIVKYLKDVESAE